MELVPRQRRPRGRRARALELALGRPVRGAALAVLAKEARREMEDRPHDQVARWWDALAHKHGFGPREAARLLHASRTRQGERGDQELATAIMRRIAEEGPTVATSEAPSVLPAAR